jgi:hypothetical protein
VEVALGVAHHVQPLNGVLTSILRQILVRLVGLHLLSCITQQTQFSQCPWADPCEACWAALAWLHDTATALQIALIDFENFNSNGDSLCKKARAEMTFDCKDANCASVAKVSGQTAAVGPGKTDVRTCNKHNSNQLMQ